MGCKQKIYLSIVVPSGLAKSPAAASEGAACNQKCPACALIRSGESDYSLLNDDSLTPDHTIRFIRDIYNGLKKHAAGGEPFAEIAFHGYEVTIPQQWEWVDAIVSGLPDIEANFEFVTNGMLLYRYRQDVVRLGMNRVTVSIDGNLNAFDGQAYINDLYRGLTNATLNTCVSLTKFIYGDPAAQARIAAMRTDTPDDPLVLGHERLVRYYKSLVGIGSVLYGPDHPVSKKLGHTNYESLKNLPETMARMGIGPWSLSPELVRAGPDGGTRIADDVPWEEMRRLIHIANECGVTTYVNDARGKLAGSIRALEHVEDIRQIEDRRFVLRLLAGSGHISADYTQPVAAQVRLTASTENAFEALGGAAFFPDEAPSQRVPEQRTGLYWARGAGTGARPGK